MTKNRKFIVNKLNIFIAIVIAFVAWVYVVYNYTPMKEVTYRDINVTFIGEDILSDMGLGIEESSVNTIDVKLDIHRKDFNSISNEDIVVVADVSEAAEGENGISLEVIPPENCKLIFQSATATTVKVAYSDIKYVDLISSYADAIEENIEPVIGSMSNTGVSVIGAEKNVSRVKYATISFKTSELGDDEKHFVMTPIAIDSKGNKVPHIVVIPNEITLKARAGETKTVPLELKINNDSHEEINYTSPNKVTIKGTAAALETINKIEATADITGAEKGAAITIHYQMPDGISIANASIGQCVKVDKEN